MRELIRYSLTLAIALAVSASAAFAQPDPPEAEPEPEPNPAPEAKDDTDINLGGRVFVRSTTTRLQGADYQHELALQSVRANIDLRKYGWLRTSIEVSFKDNDEIDLDDVFIEIELADPVALTVGQFKRPMSPIALASPWDLPTIERGLLSDNVDVGDFTVPLNLGGRVPGAMLRYLSKEGVRPDLQLGIFQADLPRQGGGAQISDLSDNLIRDVYGRAAIEPLDGFEVGASGAIVTRARTIAEIKSGFLGAVDLTIDTDRFRAWLEGFVGRTTLFDGVEARGTLLGVRVLLAPRFDDPIDHVKRIEPFVIFSALDPTDRSDNNRAFEVGVGFALWFKKLLRFQADYTYNTYEDQFPSETFTLIDRSTIRLQLGSQFR